MHFVVANIVTPLTQSKRASFVALWGGKRVDYFASLGRRGNCKRANWLTLAACVRIVDCQVSATSPLHPQSPGCAGQINFKVLITCRMF